MDDTISRQAVLRLIRNAVPKEEAVTAWALQQGVKQLPSAQPEIIRCKDCRYYNDEERLCNDLMGFGRYWSENDFCSFAERRTDE